MRASLVVALLMVSFVREAGKSQPYVVRSTLDTYRLQSWDFANG